MRAQNKRELRLNSRVLTTTLSCRITVFLSFPPLKIASVATVLRSHASSVEYDLFIETNTYVITGSSVNESLTRLKAHSDELSTVAIESYQLKIPNIKYIPYLSDIGKK